MKDIKLSEYQNTSIYFYLFDAIIKNKNLNKDEFLISIGIIVQHHTEEPVRVNKR